MKKTYVIHKHIYTHTLNIVVVVPFLSQQSSFLSNTIRMEAVFRVANVAVGEEMEEEGSARVPAFLIKCSLRIDLDEGNVEKTFSNPFLDGAFSSPGSGGGGEGH